MNLREIKASVQSGDAVALRIARIIPGAVADGANSRWTSLLLSGTASADSFDASTDSGLASMLETYRRATQRAEQLTTDAPQQPPPAPRAPTWRERLRSALSQSLFPPQPQSWGGGTGRWAVGQIMGEWGGVAINGRFQAIDFSLRFNPDGTYDYFAGQGNAPWITNSGAYQLLDNPDQRYPCKVTFHPDPSTIQIASPQHLFALRSRDLLDDQPRTFLYKFFPTATHLMLAGTWTDWHNDIGTVGLDRR